MKNVLRCFLLFLLICIAAGSVGVLLQAGYGISPGTTLTDLAGESGTGARGALRFVLSCLRLPLFMFLSGFTICAPAFCGVCVAYTGWLCGDVIYRIALSCGFSLPALPGIAVTVTAAVVCCMLALAASVNRSRLRSAAPAASELLRSPYVRGYFVSFASLAALLSALFCVFYYYTGYFPC